MPVDDNLHEFWIDFNLESQSISFYFCLADDQVTVVLFTWLFLARILCKIMLLFSLLFFQQEGQWDTLCIVENEINSYTVQGIRNKTFSMCFFAKLLKLSLRLITKPYLFHTVVYRSLTFGGKSLTMSASAHAFCFICASVCWCRTDKFLLFITFGRYLISN